MHFTALACQEVLCVPGRLQRSSTDMQMDVRETQWLISDHIVVNRDTKDPGALNRSSINGLLALAF